MVNFSPKKKYIQLCKRSSGTGSANLYAIALAQGVAKACLKMVDTPPTKCQLLSGNMIRAEFGAVYVQQNHMISYDSLCANL